MSEKVEQGLTRKEFLGVVGALIGGAIFCNKDQIGAAAAKLFSGGQRAIASAPLPDPVLEHPLGQEIVKNRERSGCFPGDVVVLPSGTRYYFGAQRSDKEIVPGGAPDQRTAIVLGDVRGADGQNRIFVEVAMGMPERDPETGPAFIDYSDVVRTKCVDYANSPVGRPNTTDSTNFFPTPEVWREQVVFVKKPGENGQENLIAARVDKVLEDNNAQVQWVDGSTGKIITEVVGMSGLFMRIPKLSFLSSQAIINVGLTTAPDLTEEEWYRYVAVTVDGRERYAGEIVVTDRVLPNQVIEQAIKNVTVENKGIVDLKEAIDNIPKGSIVVLGPGHRWGQNMVITGGIIRQIAEKDNNQVVLLTDQFSPSEQEALNKFIGAQSTDDTEALVVLTGPGTKFYKTGEGGGCSGGVNYELCQILMWARHNKIEVIATGGTVYDIQGRLLPMPDDVNTADQNTAQIITKVAQDNPLHTIIDISAAGHVMRFGKWTKGIPAVLEQGLGYLGKRDVIAIGLFNPLENGTQFFAIEDELKTKGITRVNLAVMYPRWGTSQATWSETDDGHGNPGLDILVLGYIGDYQAIYDGKPIPK